MRSNFVRHQLIQGDSTHSTATDILLQQTARFRYVITQIHIDKHVHDENADECTTEYLSMDMKRSEKMIAKVLESTMQFCTTKTVQYLLFIDPTKYQSPKPATATRNQVTRNLRNRGCENMRC